jgi:uncharacterized protein
MKYKKRHLESKILELFKYFPCVAVLGARQVGKSTIVEHLPIKNLKTVVFDPVQDVLGARKDPDLFFQNQPCPLFLDEVQYAPELLPSLKRFIDKEKKNGLFILSGSQNLSVLRNIAESLAGRVAILNLLPMSSAELSESTGSSSFLENLLFNHGWNPSEFAPSTPKQTYEAVWRGGYPGLIELPTNLYGDFFNSYMQTYVERDVRTLSNISDLQTFSRFFGLLSAHTSQEINHNQLGRELGIDRKTARAWTDIATATFQWHQVPAYSRNSIKRIAGKPKGHFGDTGLACHLQRVPVADGLSVHPLGGALFESFVFGEIIKIIETWPAKPGVYHFRSYDGKEVDLMLEMNGVIYPIEIKMKANPSRNDCRGIAALKKHFPTTTFGPGLIICSSEAIYPIKEDIYAVPWWDI